LRIAFVCVLLVCTAIGVASCGISSTNEPMVLSSSTTVMGKRPSEVYARIAKLVRSCWLNPTDPVLKHHVFYAKAPADDTSAVITIYETKSQNRRDARAFTISFSRRIKGTQIDIENRRLPYVLAQKLSADVNRWSQGNESCQAVSDDRGSGVRPTPNVKTVPSPGPAAQLVPARR